MIAIWALYNVIGQGCCCRRRGGGGGRTSWRVEGWENSCRVYNRKTQVHDLISPNIATAHNGQVQLHFLCSKPAGPAGWGVGPSWTTCV